MKSTVNLQRAFNEQVDQWVTEAIKSGISDLGDLVDSLPGVYPVDIIESLNRLDRWSALAKSAIDTTRTVAKAICQESRSSNLPVPHPLDYDWRFTNETADDLVDVCGTEAESIICLGAPTVFLSAIRMLSSEHVTLLDRNLAVTRHLKEIANRPSSIFSVDLLVDDLPEITSGIIVADPPWYMEHLKAFLWAASRLCRLGGQLLVSLPPRGTRPTVASELSQVRAYADALGFSEIRMQQDCLRYETPPFEANALRAAGCNLQIGHWRKGTLWVLRRTVDIYAERPGNELPTDDWSEAELYGTRFRFRQKGQMGLSDPALIRLINGDILPSVSRRASMRDNVDVWSSGNRVFRCLAPQILQKVVKSLAAGTIPADSVAESLRRPLRKSYARLIQNAASQIEELASTENYERQIGGGSVGKVGRAHVN